MNYIILAGLFLMASTAKSEVKFELAIANAVQGDVAVLKSEDITSKAVVLEFFAWFCSYCHRNVANVDALANEYKDNKDVMFLDVATDKMIEGVGKWLVRYQPQRIVLWDSSKDLYKQTGAKFIPTMAVLDKCKNIVYAHTGLWDAKTMQEIRNKIMVVTAKDYTCN